MSFYDELGELLSTIRIARMPESKKLTLKSMLTYEVSKIITEYPNLKLVKIADGARDNWSFLSNPHSLPGGVEIVDFYHTAEHLNLAFSLVYGANSKKTKEKFAKYRHILRHDENGISRVINALAYLHKKHPKSRKTQPCCDRFDAG